MEVSYGRRGNSALVVFSELKGLGTTVPDARLGNLWELGPIEELASAWGGPGVRTKIRTQMKTPAYPSLLVEVVNWRFC